MESEHIQRKIFTVRMDPALIKRLQYVALDTDRSIHDVFEEAARNLLKQYPNR